MNDKLKLLVVDDAPTNIDILLETLGKDYKVIVATNGVEALKVAKAFIPDLILLDIMMPEMDGFEACRRLKSDPATCNIPIIFITAMGDVSNMTEGLELGAVDYVTKPFNVAVVKIRVRNHLELKKHRDHLAELVAERTQELAVANTRLLELSQLKDDFLKMLSHEIRTPANGIIGLGEMIIDCVEPSEQFLQFRDLFRKSCQRLTHLIEDASLIADFKNLLLEDNGVISFPLLLAELKCALPDIQILMDKQTTDEQMVLKGEKTMLLRAMETTVLLVSCFSRDKSVAHLSIVVENEWLRVRCPLDMLILSEAALITFFEIESTVRSTSYAESLGLAPVVAHKILTAFGGEMKIVKGEGSTGYLEAAFMRGIVKPAPGCARNDRGAQTHG